MLLSDEIPPQPPAVPGQEREQFTLQPVEKLPEIIQYVGIIESQ